MGKQRVLIIGLDGFTWKIGKKLIQENHMPFLSTLIAKSCYGTLESVIPYETSPAWSSFQTGCHPAKTGIFAFHGYCRTARQIHLNSYNEIKVPTIWEILSAVGKKVISINMPMTSPPPHINGIIIPGLTCPEISRETTFPPEIYDKYIRSYSDYRIVNKEKQSDLAGYVKEAIHTEIVRCSMALELMHDTQWDVFSIQIQSTDAFQHRCWWALDPSAQGYSEADYAQAVEFYKKIDDILGKLIDAAGDSVLTVIVSDHGFCAKRAEIGINSWLLQNGYLVFQPVDRNALDKIKKKLKANVQLVRTMARFYGRVVNSLNKKEEIYSEKIVKHIRETIDLDRSLAFCLGGMAGSLYVTNPTKVHQINQMIGKLLDDYGPNTKEPLIASVEPMRIQDSAIDSVCPDFVIHLMPGIEARINAEEKQIVKSGIIEDRQTGTHDQEGIFVFSGAQIDSAKKIDANIVDITPTILAYLNIPIPNHIDGTILEHAFKSQMGVNYTRSGNIQKATTNYSNPDQASVEKQLKDLGYL